MKQHLSPEHRAALINYRFERSHEALKEVEYLRKGNYFNSAISRLYYACYYAATALLVAKNIEATTHNGVKTMLSYHFVRTGLLSLEHGATFSNLFDNDTIVTMRILHTMMLLWLIIYFLVPKLLLKPLNCLQDNLFYRLRISFSTS